MKRLLMLVILPAMLISPTTAVSTQLCGEVDMLARSVMNIRQADLPLSYVKATLDNTSARKLTERLLDDAYALPVVPITERTSALDNFSYAVQLTYTCE